jgi:chromosomal replication initiator protein
MHPLAGHFMAYARHLATLGKPRRVWISDIQDAVAEHYGITVSDLISDRRAVAIARPRQIAMALCRELTLRSYPEIGRRFGDRDHSTIIHACKRIRELREKEAELDADVIAIREVLTGIDQSAEAA